MKMREIMESVGSPKPARLKEKYGGGSLSSNSKFDSKGEPISVSATYLDKAGDVEAKFEITDKLKSWITKQDNIPHQMKIEDRELVKMFDNYVISDMLTHYEKYLNLQDPHGNRVLDLARKMRQMKESTFNRDEALSEIRQEVKPFMDDLYALVDRMTKNRQLRENASVGGTGSGSVATIATPIGGVIKRNNDSFFAGVPVSDSDPYPNTPEYMKKKKKKNVS